MNAEVAESYRICKGVSRRAASSFYLSFSLLPQQQRRAMYALYAFSRCTDDLGDSLEPVANRREQLSTWREALTDALDGRCTGPMWPALIDTVERFRIPSQYLYAIVDGVAMDLQPPCYKTFDELRRYCYHVASAVGLTCIHIWGCPDDRATALASECGVAFQMTNILRDLREDADCGRVYLPREELAAFDCQASDLRSAVLNDRLAGLLRFQIERTERLYAEAAPLAAMIPPGSRRAFLAMFGAYRELLQEIKRRDGDVFSRRVRLGAWRRVRIVCSALLRPVAAERGIDPPSAAKDRVPEPLDPPISSAAKKDRAPEPLRQSGN